MSMAVFIASLWSLTHIASMRRVVPARANAAPASLMLSSSAARASAEQQVDVVVIGSGVGGLSCAAMLARYGVGVLVLESHAIAGGCAHGFERGSFAFDSGPSLYNGMAGPSTNPLRQVLDAVGEDVEWIRYDGWEMLLPNDRRFYFRTGSAADWKRTLREFGGPNALSDWVRLEQFCRPITKAASGIAPLCLRDDPGALVAIMLHALGGFVSAAPVARLLTAPFSQILKEAGVTDRFLIDWFDYLAFALSGLDSTGTLGAAVAYTVRAGPHRARCSGARRPRRPVHRAIGSPRAPAHLRVRAHTLRWETFTRQAANSTTRSAAPARSWMRWSAAFASTVGRCASPRTSRRFWLGLRAGRRVCGCGEAQSCEPHRQLSRMHTSRRRSRCCPSVCGPRRAWAPAVRSTAL